MCPTPNSEQAREADARQASGQTREKHPDRRRAPDGPEPDHRATDHAIERLMAVGGR